MGRYSDTVNLLNSESARLREELFAAIVTEIPQGAGMYPPHTTKVSQELIDALSYLFRSADATGTLPEPAQERLRAWALDLRRLGFPPATYEVFARLIRQVLGVGIEGRFLLEDTAAEMARAAHAADLEGVPAAAAAKVTSIRSEGGISIVRLQAGMPVSYRPGQYMPVMQVGRQGVWRNLAPALPSNPFGQLEFHVNGEIEPQVGDYITLGAARGPAPCDNAEELAIVAVGTGAAAAKAIVFGALEQPTPPRITVALLGRVADRTAFERLAAAVDWCELCTQPAAASRVVYCGPYEELVELGIPARALQISPDAPADWS